MQNQRRRGHQDEDPDQEALSRLRRIETRLTQLLIGLGFDTQSQKPLFEDGRISLPSPHSSIKEIIDSIPESWQGPVGVFIGAEQVAVIDRSRH